MVKKKELFIIPLLSAFLSFLWFKDGYILAGGESGLIFQKISVGIKSTILSWSEVSLGGDTGLTVASVPFYAFMALIDKFLPNYLLQATFFFGVLNISGFGIYLLTKELFKDLNKKYYFLAILFYWFNIYALVNVWNRFLNNFIYFYAFLPLSLYFFLKGINKRSYTEGLKLSLVSILFSFSYVGIYFLLLNWFLFLLTITFFFVCEKNWQVRKFYIKFFCVTFITFVLVNAWWLSQILGFLFSSSYSDTVSTVFTSQGNVATLGWMSQQLGMLSDIFLLKHGTFFNGGLNWVKSYLAIPFILIELFLSTLVIWTIWKFKRIKEVLYLSCVLLTIVFLMKGINPPFGDIYFYLFQKFSFLQVFRNPFEKFGLLLIICFTPLLVFGINEIDTRIKTRKLKSTFTILIFGLIIVMGFPLWTNQVFSYGEESEKHSLQVEVPEYYSNVNDILNLDPSTFRLLLLPIGGDPLFGQGIAYNWDKPYSGVETSEVLFDKSSISINTTTPFYFDFVNNLSKYQLSDQIINYMPFVSGKYIILRDDINFKTNKLADPKVVQQHLSHLESKGFIDQLERVGNLMVYGLDKDYIWPRIYFTSNIFSSNTKDPSKIVSLSKDFPKRKLVLLDLDQQRESDHPFPVILFPQYIFDDATLNVLNQIENSNTGSILQFLPQIKYTPDQSEYQLERSLEDKNQPSHIDYWRFFNYQLQLLSKRAVEHFYVNDQKRDERLLASTEKALELQFSRFEPLLSGIIGGGGDISSQTVPYLLTLNEVLKRSGSGTYKKLDNLLISTNLKPNINLKDLESTDLITVYKFKVPQKGIYKIVLPNEQVSEFFLDNPKNLIDLKTNQNLELTRGDHYLGIFTKKEKFEKILYQDNELIVDEKDLNIQIELGDIPESYEISFNYKTEAQRNINLEIRQDNDLIGTPLLKTVLPISSDFKEVKFNVKSSTGATFFNLNISPQVKIRDLRMIIKNIPEITLINGNLESNPDTDTIWNWTQVNPIQYRVLVNKKDSTPEVLVFSELYNAGWKVYWSDENNLKIGKLESTHGEYEFTGNYHQPIATLNKQALSGEQHKLVNGYANGWLINKSGEYELIIEYSKQRLLYIGYLLSSASVLVLLVILFVFKRKI